MPTKITIIVEDILVSKYVGSITYESMLSEYDIPKSLDNMDGFLGMLFEAYKIPPFKVKKIILEPVKQNDE